MLNFFSYKASCCLWISVLFKCWSNFCKFSFWLVLFANRILRCFHRVHQRWRELTGGPLALNAKVVEGCLTHCLHMTNTGAVKCYAERRVVHCRMRIESMLLLHRVPTCPPQHCSVDRPSAREVAAKNPHILHILHILPIMHISHIATISERAYPLR